MMRFPALTALLGALAVALFVSYFTSGTVVVQNPNTSAASSTGLAVLPSVSLPSLEIPSMDGASSTPLVATTTATVKAKPKPVVPKAAPASGAAASSTPPATPLPPAAPAGDISASGAVIRSALVNIICNARAGSGLQSISGSGVIISPAGVILTNAHIGQYFLLRDQGVSCVVRTGSPAANAYYAHLAFVSPAWINENSAVVTEQLPTGTGEHDFALLAIDQSATGFALPATFPYVPLATDSPLVGEPVVIGSYGAQFLISSAIQSALYPTIVYGSIKNIYTFLTNTIDTVSLGGSAAAQEGSSGGGVVDAAGNLTATITTSTIEGDTSTRELNAITATYIRRDYAAESGSSLSSLLAESNAQMITNFAPQMPALEAQITAHLSH